MTSSTLSVGVIGYYGFGNVGDEAILESLRKFLAPHRVIVLPAGLLNSPATIKRLNAFDFLILGGGGLFRKAPPAPFGQFDVWGPELQTPIGVLGLGISSLPPHFVNATNRMVEQSAFFVVRDEESRRLVDHPKVKVAPDLTFYHPLEFEPLERTGTEPVCGVNLRPAHVGFTHWVRAVNELPYAKRAMPFSVHPALGDREALLAVDPNCPELFCVADYRHIDFLIGTAFHSIVFAIQTGTPVVAINYDQKVARLMEEVGLSEYMLEWDEAKRVQACCEQVLANREAIRRRMQSYTREAKSRLHQELQEPQRIINTAAPPSVEGPKAEKLKVSVVVNWQKGNARELQSTLATCHAQTHELLELIVTSDEGRSGELRTLVKDDPVINIVNLSESTSDWRSAGLDVATGKYITWMEAGSEFTEDAVALMVDTLRDGAETDLVHACFFLTNDGIIERKVRLDSARGSGTPRSLGPCFLLRRSVARRFLVEMQDQWEQPALLKSYKSVYLQTALFFRPSSKWESYLYQSLLAHARDDAARGKILLTQALAAENSLDVQDVAQEMVEMLVIVAGKAPSSSDAAAFIMSVFQHLPPEANGMRKLQRRAQANIAFNQFYESYQAGNWRAVLRSAWRGVRHDPGWLRNRGVWVMVLRAAVASIGGQS